MQPLRRWSWRSTGAIICDHCLPRYLPYVARLIDEYAVQSLDERVLAEACEFGASLSDLDAVLSRTTPNWKEVVKAATKGGHLHVFRWMRERQDDRGPWKADFDLATKEAARYGHLKLLKWLHERGLSCASFTVEFEALGYHLAAAKWQLLKGATLTGSDHERSVEQAAQNGLLATVEWIEMTFRCAGTSHAMEGAARKGDLDMLRWLHQQKSCSEACSTKAMDAAVRRGHLHVVEWLFENCSKGCSRSAVCEAARAGNLQMLQWLHKDCSDRFDPHVMDIVASEGHLELVKWLQQHRSEGCTLYAVSDAASNGHLDVLRWLHDNRTEGWTTYVMDVAAIGGHLHVVKWLHENRAEGCTEIGLDYAAQNGHVDVLWWLLEHYLDKCGDDLMEIAALAGHLDVVQYLDKKLNYRASDWGLGAAAKQGWMKTLLVLVQHYYHDDRAVGSYGLDAVCKAFDEMLTHSKRLQHRCCGVKHWDHWSSFMAMDTTRVCL